MDNSLRSSSKSLKTLEQNSQRTARALGAATGILVGFITGRGFQKMVDATVKQEQAIAQLEAAIESTGNASGRSSQQLQAYAAELQQIGVQGDEAVLGVQSLLLTFKQIEGDNFDRTTRAVLDLSVAMNQDLKSSAVQLGKALNDPVANLGALSRTGIQFAEDQKVLIKELASTGRVAEAQAIILKELESQFGGSAAAARNTLGGALQALQNNFGDLFEASGPGLDSLTQSINDVSAIFADPQFQANVQKVVGEILKLGGTGVEVFANFGSIMSFVKDEFAALYGIVSEDDIPRLLEKQQSLQDRINRTGFLGFIQNTGELQRQLDVVNQQLEEAYSRINTQPQATSEASPDASEQGPSLPSPPVDTAIYDAGYSAAMKVAAATREWSFAVQSVDEMLAGLGDDLETNDFGYAAMMKANQAANEVQTGLAAIEEYIEPTKTGFESLAESMGDSLNRNFESFVDGVARGTADVKDLFKNMVASILAEQAKIQATKFLTSLFGGPTAAQGMAVDNGVQAFASGGVVSRPTLFPMAQGMGLMGEAGPEAIMPLQRTANGDLGVKAAPMNVTINNNAPGVDVSATQGPEGLTIDVVRAVIARDIATGGNAVSNAVAGSFGLQRAGV
jgi:hypothetical protein